MKISELLPLLSNILGVHGDLDVHVQPAQPAATDDTGEAGPHVLGVNVTPPNPAGDVAGSVAITHS